MKKIFTFIIVAITVTTLFGQNKKAAKQRLDSILYQVYNTSSQWEDNVNTKYIFDAGGNFVQVLNFSWNKASSQWVNMAKVDYVNNANGKVLTQTSYNWITGTSSWQSANKWEHHYDANGYDTLMIAYDGQGAAWVQAERHHYTYDVKGNQTLDQYDLWNGTASQWLLSGKAENTYDASNRNTQLIVYNWMKPTSTWIPYYKNIFTYDTYGNKLLSLALLYNQVSSGYDSSYKLVNTIDPNGNNVQSTGSLYQSGSWVGYGNVINTFNNSYAKNDIIWPGGPNQYNHMLLTYINQQFSGGVYVNSGKGICYYSPVGSTGIAKNEIAETKIYPNPTTGLIYFDNLNSASINIYNLVGELVYSLSADPMAKNNTIDISSLAHGIYSMQLIDANGKSVFRKIQVIK